MTWYCEAWETAIERADAQGITVSSENQAWIRFWADYRKEIHIPAYRVMTDNDITDGLKLMEGLGR
jgi:hypothetical protein